MKDELGQRMKLYYENRFKQFLPRRTFTIIRVDGKAFHTFTKGCVKPFDDAIMGTMDETMLYLCKNIMGAKFAYTQSDEISILLSDFDNLDTQAWFDGNVQKICSVSASMATGVFNRVYPKNRTAFFDARVFQLPYRNEVINYFIWRQQDAIRNSVRMVAQSLFSHKELQGKNTTQLKEMILTKEKNWDKMEIPYQRGTGVRKVVVDKKTHTDQDGKGYEEYRWDWGFDFRIPIFSKQRDYFDGIIAQE